MPKVLPEYLELRRQQIVDAAAACFARKGFHHSTMQDICEEADLSPGAVYRYFRSKEEIIEAMCTRGHSEDVERIHAIMAGGETLEVFENLIRAFFMELENRELCILSIELLSEARRNSYVQETLERGQRTIRGALTEIVRAAQAQEDIDPALDPEAVARVMISLYQGLLNQKIVEPTLDVEPYAQAMKALFGGTFWRGGRKTAKTAAGAALRH
jgi:AcrR family transcriptional regulator